MFKSGTLNEIGIRHGTDKSDREDGHDYLRKYEFFLAPLRDSEFTVLELGIYKGSSVKTWEEYFPKARIVGVDIDPSTERFAGGRIEVIVGDLSDAGFVGSLGNLGARVILDDASHLWSHQLISLITLYRSLPSGGVFIMEDIHTSFMPMALGYGYKKFSCVPPAKFLMKVAEYLTGNGKCYAAYPNRPLRPISRAWLYHKEIKEIADATDAVVFIERACLLVKK